MTQTSIPRLRSVRFKDGRASLRVIRAAEDRVYRDGFDRDAMEISEHNRNMAGYAIIAWSKDGGTSVSCATNGTPVPMMMIPDFVRTCCADWLHSQESK